MASLKSAAAPVEPEKIRPIASGSPLLEGPKRGRRPNPAPGQKLGPLGPAVPQRRFCEPDSRKQGPWLRFATGRSRFTHRDSASRRPWNLTPTLCQARVILACAGQPRLVWAPLGLDQLARPPTEHWSPASRCCLFGDGWGSAGPMSSNNNGHTKFQQPTQRAKVAWLASVHFKVWATLILGLAGLSPPAGFVHGCMAAISLRAA